MANLTAEQTAILDELEKRRNALSPDQVAVLDELQRRRSEPVKGGSSSFNFEEAGKNLGVGALESIPAALGGWAGGATGLAVGKTPQSAATGAALGSGGAEALYQGLKFGMGKMGMPTLTPPPGSWGEFGERVGWAAATGPLDATGSILKPLVPKSAGLLLGYETEAARLAARFKLPFTRGIQRQSIGSVTAEGITRRTVTGWGEFYKADKQLAAALSQAADDVATEISSMRLTPSQAGELAQETVRSVIRDSGERLGGITDRIVTEAGNPSIVIKDNVSQTAKELLEEGEFRAIQEFPSLGGVESVSKARAILQDFAQGTRVEKTGQFNPEGVEVVRSVDRTIPFSEAKFLRSFLFKIAHSGEVDMGKGALGRLNHALHDAMTAAVRKAGAEDLAKEFEQASAAHHALLNTVEGNVIKSLMRTQPEAALDMFLAGNRSVSTASQFYQIIEGRPQVREAVQAAVWRRIIEKSTKEEVLVSNALESQLKQARAEGIDTIFSPEQLSAIDDFAKAANYASISPTATKPLSAHAPSLMAFGQSAMIMQSLGALGGTGGMIGALWTGNMPGFALSAAGTGTILIGPHIMARMMTRPAAVKAMTKAMKTPLGAKPAGQIASAIMAMAVQTERRMKAQGEIPDLQERMTSGPEFQFPFLPPPPGPVRIAQ